MFSLSLGAGEGAKIIAYEDHAPYPGSLVMPAKALRHAHISQ
ncbi:hypothetical protein [Azospirillum doebereinerae]